MDSTNPDGHHRTQGTTRPGGAGPWSGQARYRARNLTMPVSAPAPRRSRDREQGDGLEQHAGLTGVEPPPDHHHQKEAQDAAAELPSA